MPHSVLIIRARQALDSGNSKTMQHVEDGGYVKTIQKINAKSYALAA